MSSSGYQVGLSAGYAHSRAAQASYEAAINEWRLHSENLKHQVNALNERIEIMQGHFEANNYVLLLLLEELRKTSPNSPLLVRKTETRFVRRPLIDIWKIADMRGQVHALGDN